MKGGCIINTLCIYHTSEIKIKNFIKKFFNLFRKLLIELVDYIENNDNLKYKNIDKFKINNCGYQIYLWDFLDHRWKYNFKHSFKKKFYIKKNIGKIKCDIQEINNLINSKSNLGNFKNLDEVVIKNSDELISSLTEENLIKNIKHKESKIFHTSNEFLTFTAYNNKLTWNNNGGSHHFMAARYIAQKLNKKIKIEATLEIQYLNSKFIINLFEEYSIFLINHIKNEDNYSNREIIDNDPLINELKKMKIEYRKCFDKENKEDFIFLFLKNNDKKEKKIINLLNQNNYINVKNYFTEYLKEQEKNLYRKWGN